MILEFMYGGMHIIVYLSTMVKKTLSTALTQVVKVTA